MSLILEALKKTENKHRRKNNQNPRTIHEPVQRKNGKSRAWILGILLLLLVNAALLLWFFGPWQQPSSSPTTELVSSDTAPVETNTIESESVIPQVAPSSRRNNIAPTAVVTQKQQPVAKALPVPRNENQVYSFGQLPVSIQKRIPALQMSLHAYNRDDANSSMVQLNDQIMREGDMVTDNISLEQIAADGVVLRYDGYRFLLPRRGN